MPSYRELLKSLTKLNKLIISEIIDFSSLSLELKPIDLLII
jgi:hypothetical protein